jgi:hypothetical protein
MLFHWLGEDQIVGQLAIEEEALLDPVLNYEVTVTSKVCTLFSKPIVVTASDAEVPVVPIPG